MGVLNEDATCVSKAIEFNHAQTCRVIAFVELELNESLQIKSTLNQFRSFEMLYIILFHIILILSHKSRMRPGSSKMLCLKHKKHLIMI